MVLSVLLSALLELNLAMKKINEIEKLDINWQKFIAEISTTPLEKPCLYIVATPIGNLEDISIRSLRILSQVDWIVCEDTRRTSKILQKYAIHNKSLKSYRQHQKQKDLDWVYQKLSCNCTLALTSEAGTPGISDPGADIVREVRARQLAKIVPIPGPSALATALSVSGWQTNPTIFTGFLSMRKSRRVNALKELNDFHGAIVLYESVHRLKKIIMEIKENIPHRDLLLTREMSKYYEEFILFRGDIPMTWEEKLKGLKLKGEFTLVIAPLRVKS